jgi:hypothetical protein
MSFETRFNAAIVTYSHVTVLEKDITYFISHLDIVKSRYGLSFVASLRHPTDGNLVKAFLPKRYASAFAEKALLEINQGTMTYQLVSKGLGAHK